VNPEPCTLHYEMQVRAVAQVQELAGVSVRGSDIFNKRTVMGAAKGMVRRQMEGVKGVSLAFQNPKPRTLNCTLNPKP
jgi:hypothetical protein